MQEEDGIVSKNIEKLCEYGASLGLSAIEIDKCLYDALVNDSDKAKGDKEVKENFKAPKPKQPSSSCLKFFITAIKWFCIFIAVVILGIGWLEWHPPSGRIFMQAIEPIAWDFQRYLRFTTMMIPKYFDTSGMYHSMCVLNNPLFREQNEHCNLCDGILSADRISEEQMNWFFQSNYNDHRTPFVVKDFIKDEVSLSTFFESFKNNSKTAKYGFTFLKTLGVSLKNFEQVFMNLNENDFTGEEKDNSQVHMRSKSVGATHLMRSMFPRPFFITLDTEISLEKLYFIDGPKGKPYSFPNTFLPNAFYIQATGTRKLIFSPYSNCVEACETFEILVQPKEIVNYDDSVWKVESAPSNPEGTGGLSLGILGSFS